MPMLKRIQDQWNALFTEADLESEDRSTLGRRFRKTMDAFYKKRRENREHQDWETWANLMLKEEFCAELEGLAQSNDLFQVSSQLKKLTAKWKTVGPVPKAHNQKIWKRYKAIGDELYSKCKEFYKELDKERSSNLKLKEHICAKVEEITSQKNLDSAYDSIKRLQQEWKEIGAISKLEERKISARFAKACDSYFEARRDLIRKQKERQEENLSKKKKLCERASVPFGQRRSFRCLAGNKNYSKRVEIHWFCPQKKGK